MASKDDTALWLHNKLGSSVQLWSSSTIVTQYNLDKLNSIKDCFQNLDSLVKIKFFLSLFHIPRRNIEELKSIVQEIIDETIETCNDQWVLSITLFVKSYWNKQTLITDNLPDIDSFKDSLNDLRKNLKKCESLKMLPLECDYLTKYARATYADVPQASKHFNLIRLAKSAALIQDLKLKATNYSKTKKPNEKSSTLPYLNRSLSKNINQNDKSNTGFTSSTASCFTSSNMSSGSQTPGFLKRSALSNSTITGKASLTKRDVGIKLLDLEDQPILSKEAKRKKKELEKEVVKKAKISDVKQKKNDKKDTQEETAYDSNNDDESKEDVKNSMDYEVINKKSTEILEPTNVDSADNLINQIIDNNNQKPSYTIGLMNNSNSEEVNKSIIFENEMQSVLNENININMDLNIQTKSSIFEYVNSEINNSKANDNNNKNIELNRNNIITVESNIISSDFITKQSNIETDSGMSNSFNSKKPQHSLTLTREQMLQAQEMFCNSNRLTRPEKALILGFMAGSRDNPRPEQGPIVTIKLNEAEETLASSTGQQHKVLSEIYFQMNYENGEYKKIKKIKPIVISIN